MQRGGPELLQGGPVLGGSIAGVALQAVTGEAAGKAPQQRVPFLLRQHAGGGDGGAAAVALGQGELGALPAAQGQNAVDEEQGWRSR
jgi:hypothetical protein